MPELLVPAGSPEAVTAAVQNGADAVYLSFDELNACREAENFSDSAFETSVRYCRIRGCRVYLALNSSVREEELPKAGGLALRAQRAGVDAVIVRDLGVFFLLRRLLPEKQITKLVGMDVSAVALARAEAKLKPERKAEQLRDKLTLMQGALTYRDERLTGFDAVCVVEVAEHIDPDRLPAFARTVFRYCAPKTVILTTPNRSYNQNYAALSGGGLRHPDHRFEWTKEEFTAWTGQVCADYGYTVRLSWIGDTDEAGRQPTQMGVFTKCE